MLDERTRPVVRRTSLAHALGTSRVAPGFAGTSAAPVPGPVLGLPRRHLSPATRAALGAVVGRPSRGAPAHPALHRLGGEAGGYVRARQWRRRRAIGREAATALLGATVLAAIASLGVAGSHLDAAPTASAAVAPVPAARARAVRVVSAHLVPTAARPHVSAPSPGPAAVATTVATPFVNGRAFPGAFAARGSAARFVAYPADANNPFLDCTRGHESDLAGGYRAVDAAGVHFGAYQFLQSTWNNVARHVRRWDLVGVNPRDAAPRDQDWMALYLYRWQGAGHWEGRCAGL